MSGNVQSFNVAKQWVKGHLGLGWCPLFLLGSTLVHRHKLQGSGLLFTTTLKSPVNCLYFSRRSTEWDIL